IVKLQPSLPLNSRPVTLADVGVLHRFYLQSKRYFEIIAAPLPSIEDVTRELETALSNPRRRLEFYCSAEEVVAYLDTTLDYPKTGDVTVNLLLVAEQKQHLGLGSQIMLRLESQLKSRTKRILAGVFGHNSRAVRFWERLGYYFAVDARPVLSWYAKDLEPSEQAQKKEIVMQ
ncbi:MAG: GNAT family N-acetyltransferase, partial [Deinococcales bacterium]